MRVIIAFVCLSLLGLFLIPKLPVKLNPSRRLPEVHVSFSMPGQSAQVVEAEVTSKLEGMLNRMKGVQQINSYSSNGSGRITIRLSEHVDPDLARFEISVIVRQAWPTLPQSVTYPSVRMSGTSNEIQRPFLNYTVNAPFSPVQIQECISDVLSPKIAEIKGIDKVDVYGAGRMIYRLEYDYKQLQNLHTSVYDVRSSIQSYLTKEFLGIGKIFDENQTEQWIRLALTAENSNQPFDPALIQVKNSEGTILYLNQLVETTYEEEEASSAFRINGLNSIYLSVTAEETANQLTLSKQVQDLLASYKKILPAGYELHLQYDAAEYLQAEMDKIYFRSGLTVLLLLCFVFLVYRNLKYSLLILFSLLANIAIAAIFYSLFQLEMQLFSLAGLTISLTLIIDNTIIMADQILKQRNKKAFLAILTATLTSIGALTVILFMDEAVRNNLQDFAWVIIINLTVSLLVALFLTPALIDKFRITKKRNKKILRGKRKLVYFNRGYEKIIVFMQRRKGWFIALIILAFGFPVFLLPAKIEHKHRKGIYAIHSEDLNYWAKLYNQTLGSSFYTEKIKPVSDVALGGTMRLFAQKVQNGSYSSGERSETTLYVAASLPNGATREQMDALIRKMENYIGQYPEIRQFETRIESGQRANIRILFTKKDQRSNFPHMLKSKVISKALELGGGSWSVHGMGDGFDNDVKDRAGSSRIKLLGYNYDELKTHAYSLRDTLLQYRRIKEITIDSKFSWYKNDYTEFVFDLQKERLAQAGILPVDLFQSTAPLFEKSMHAGNWVNDGRVESIRLFARQARELDIWNLENYPGQASEKPYKLSEIARIEKWALPQAIAKENQQYLLCLQYEYIGAYAQATKVMERHIELFNEKTPLGYKAAQESSYYWWGNTDKKSNHYRLLFLVAAIIFFMCSFLFNSVKQPLIVIFIIPVSFIGLFLTFYWFKLNFDQGGFAAFILLAALSVNANIYLLNEFNNIRKNPRIPILKAYIKAWNRKISPIFLTVLSTVLGFIPFLVGEYREAFWFPLAAGSIGGLAFSLIALFFFLPLFMQAGKLKS
jgi:multidrug efflux pump subunit AcrB